MWKSLHIPNATRTALIPNNRQKSFYGKATVIRTDECVYLQSYDTIVCAIDLRTRKFRRFWDDYSATTMRHINSFIDTFRIDGGGKAWWCAQPIEKEVI